MKILVFGASGQLGRCFLDQIEATSHEVIALSKAQVDIEDFKKNKRYHKKIAPDIIYNAAAYTSVDEAEIKSQKANNINNLAVSNLADAAFEIDCWLIHFSTDYVFDGKSSVPYKEDDKTNPIGVYGKTKLDGEFSIINSGCKYLIIRTSWIFSEYGNNFLKTMLNLSNKKNIKVVSDQYGCPTYAQDIAIASLSIVNNIYLNDMQSEIFHFCGDKIYSWHEFANEIFDKLAPLVKGCSVEVNQVSSEVFNAREIRPAYSALDCSKIQKQLDIKLSNCSESIVEVLKKLYAG